MKRSRVRQMDRQGFTLIELLIVLAILVGIMALALPRLMGSRKKAEINTAKTQIGLFQSALQKYEFDTRGLPMTEQGLAALTAPPAASDETGAVASTGWDGPYLDSIPDDPWGTPYQYEYPPSRGSGLRPDIWSLGPDRTDGTVDDVWEQATAGGVDEDGNPIEESMDPGMDPMDRGAPIPPVDGTARPGQMPGRMPGTPAAPGGPSRTGNRAPPPPAGGMPGRPPVPSRSAPPPGSTPARPPQPNR